MYKWCGQLVKAYPDVYARRRTPTLQFFLLSIFFPTPACLLLAVVWMSVFVCVLVCSCAFFFFFFFGPTNAQHLVHYDVAEGRANADSSRKHACLGVFRTSRDNNRVSRINNSDKVLVQCCAMGILRVFILSTLRSFSHGITVAIRIPRPCPSAADQ